MYQIKTIIKRFRSRNYRAGAAPEPSPGGRRSCFKPICAITAATATDVCLSRTGQLYAIWWALDRRREAEPAQARPGLFHRPVVSRRTDEPAARDPSERQDTREEKERPDG